MNLDQFIWQQITCPSQFCDARCFSNNFVSCIEHSGCRKKHRAAAFGNLIHQQQIGLKVVPPHKSMIIIICIWHWHRQFLY